MQNNNLKLKEIKTPKGNFVTIPIEDKNLDDPPEKSHAQQ